MATSSFALSSPSFTPLSCSSCRMWSQDTALFDFRGCCAKCSVLTSLEARLSELEARVCAMQGSAPSYSQVVSGTAKTEHKQEFVTVKRGKGKSAKPQPRQPEIPLHNRFLILDEWEDSDSPPDPPRDRVALGESPQTRAPQPQQQWTRPALIIGSSIVRDVTVPQAYTSCHPGARMGDIEGRLRVLKKSKTRYRRIVIHAGGNDLRRGQSEVLRLQVEAVCELAKSMSESVFFSGPLPEPANSRFADFNKWARRWCSENDVGFIENWTSFEGQPGLLRRDGIHPTPAGSAVLAANIASSLR